jgi:hypothetical protein
MTLKNHRAKALRKLCRKFIENSPRLEIDIDGYVDEKGIEYIGKATKQPDGKWACLANVAGALCLVELTITPKEIEVSTDKCDVCGVSDHGNQMGWGIRGTTLHCPKCFSRIRP